MPPLAYIVYTSSFIMRLLPSRTSSEHSESLKPLPAVRDHSYSGSFFQARLMSSPRTLCFLPWAWPFPRTRLALLTPSLYTSFSHSSVYAYLRPVSSLKPSLSSQADSSWTALIPFIVIVCIIQLALYYTLILCPPLFRLNDGMSTGLSPIDFS